MAASTSAPKRLEAQFGPRPNAEPQRNSFYLPELDVLRFFAFLAVFVTHLPRNGPGSFIISHAQGHVSRLFAATVCAGGFGVDLFFTLSAYLITTLLLKERDATGAVNLKWFYVRRILRIWPLYFFALILIFLLAHVAHFATIQWFYFLSFSFLAGNFALSAWGSPSLMIAPLWSVSMEEQFYLLWPPVVRRASRARLGLAAVFLVAVSAVSRIVMCSHGRYGEAIWFNTLCRMDPIAVGILIAVAPDLSSIASRVRVRVALVLFGIATWLFASDPVALAGLLRNAAQISLVYPVVALGCGAFLVSTLGAGAAKVKLMRNSWLVYFGKISYGLYVFHPIVLTIGRRLVPPNPSSLIFAVYMAGSLATTTAIAAVSYRYLESPFLRLKSRFAHVQSRPV